MTPQRLAFIAGVAWLSDGPNRAPDPNELAGLADAADVDGLEFVRACVPVAEAVAWVVAGRQWDRESTKPIDLHFWRLREEAKRVRTNSAK